MLKQYLCFVSSAERKMNGNKIMHYSNIISYPINH